MKTSKFLFSASIKDQDYGLYVMEIDCSLHSDGMYLVYCFDSDKFSHINEELKSGYVQPAQLSICRDEFLNEYAGVKLQERIKEAVKAYKEEFPGYKEYYLESEAKLLNLPEQ